MPNSNRRVGLAAIPADLERYLTPEQLAGLNRAEKYGWTVKFVRRPTVVLEYEDGSVLGVLEEDGTLNKNYSTEVRDQDDRRDGNGQMSFAPFRNRKVR
jgi:hypothetical protein